jgi:hypothetical protein
MLSFRLQFQKRGVLRLFFDEIPQIHITRPALMYASYCSSAVQKRMILVPFLIYSAPIPFGPYSLCADILSKSTFSSSTLISRWKLPQNPRILGRSMHGVFSWPEVLKVAYPELFELVDKCTKQEDPKFDIFKADNKKINFYYILSDMMDIS